MIPRRVPRIPSASAVSMRRWERARRQHMGGLTPRQGSPEACERRYVTRRDRERALADALPEYLVVECHDCGAQRRPGEQGALVLDGKHWTCDVCAEDQRSKLHGELAHRARQRRGAW